jgi:hypothetical protein
LTASPRRPLASSFENCNSIFLKNKNSGKSFFKLFLFCGLVCLCFGFVSLQPLTSFSFFLCFFLDVEADRAALGPLDAGEIALGVAPETDNEIPGLLAGRPPAAVHRVDQRLVVAPAVAAKVRASGERTGLAARAAGTLSTLVTAFS